MQALPIRWSRVLAVVVLLVAATEFTARGVVFFFAHGPFRSLSPNIWSPYGLVRNNPDFTSPVFKISRQGFRNDEIFVTPKPPRTLRVLLLGGSVLYSGIAPNAFVASESRIENSATIAAYLRDQLRRDPNIGDLNVEVINAAVNFNRIVEVSVSYLSEYLFLDPDVVVVFGSANNFGEMPLRGEIYARQYRTQAKHPWHLEFERNVLRNDSSALFENIVNRVSDHLASVALAKKILLSVMDRIVTVIATRSRRDETGTVKLPEDADWTEVDAYIRDYMGYASALTAAAREHSQAVAFFWEHWLADMPGIKPLSDTENHLLATVGAGRRQADRAFMDYVREQVGKQLSRLGVPLVDPLLRLAHERETVFIDYLHYTRAGNRIMAEEVYTALRDLFRDRASEVRSQATRDSRQP